MAQERRTRIARHPYPRSATAPSLDASGPIGYQEMVKLTGRAMTANYKWREHLKLPYADGPIVHGQETWLRPTFLAWAYRNGFTLDDNGAALPCHEEAAHWASQVQGNVADRVVKIMAAAS